MIQEDQMKQREDSLKQLQLKLDQEKQYIEKRRKELLPTEIGLQNIGATCYMNATLQAFYPDLIEFVFGLILFLFD